VEQLDPSVFNIKANLEDTPVYEGSTNGPLADAFRKEMDIEWDMLNLFMKAW
jgi:hypothetical protein